LTRDEEGGIRARPDTRSVFPAASWGNSATPTATSKAGSVTHFEAEVLVENVARFLAGRELDTGYHGHANCFIETGFHKALLIDFKYETEPLPGHFPTVVGLPLLRESRLYHLGKARRAPRVRARPVGTLTGSH
jgi:sulfide:quinone oxidoreductase